MMRSLAFVFPGQGSQRVGMLHAVDSQGEIARLLDAAEGLSDLPLRQLAAEGPDSALADTRAAQPLLYLGAWAWARELERAGIHPMVVAGHSLGELTALAYAGVFSVEAGLELVCTRARLMADAASAVPGSMAAVLGMDREGVSSLLEGSQGVWVANDNAPGQVVVSGTHPDLERATGMLLEAGARRVVPLSVAGAFHSPLMAPARGAFARVLRHAAFDDAQLPVVQNTVAEPATDAEEIRARLLEQIVSPVRWTETMRSFVRLGVEVVVETGPGAVLTGLAKRTEGLTAVSAEVDGIERVKELAS